MMTTIKSPLNIYNKLPCTVQEYIDSKSNLPASFNANDETPFALISLCSQGEFTLTYLSIRRLAAQALLKCEETDSIDVKVLKHIPLGGNNESFQCLYNGIDITVYVFHLLENVLVGGARATMIDATMCKDNNVSLSAVEWLDTAKTECFIAGPRQE